MSYIRCGSNPECLYVVESADFVNFFFGSAVVGEQRSLWMHSVDFHGLMKAFSDQDFSPDDRTVFGRASLHELVYPEVEIGDPDFGRWEISYDAEGHKWSERLWYVTLAYIGRRWRDAAIASTAPPAAPEEE